MLLGELGERMRVRSAAVAVVEIERLIGAVIYLARALGAAFAVVPDV